MSTSNWRKWSLNPDHLPLQDMPHFSTLMENILNCKIKFSTKLDKIWWVHKPKGFFNIKESYELEIGHARALDNNIRIKIWYSNLWPKVVFFL
jgi:hypothetical protein